ncbi:hypothetical protein, partial [Celeribacter sp.]
SIVEAGKQLYASTGTPERKRKLVHIPVTVPPLHSAEGNHQHRDTLPEVLVTDKNTLPGT